MENKIKRKKWAQVNDNQETRRDKQMQYSNIDL